MSLLVCAADKTFGTWPTPRSETFTTPRVAVTILRSDAECGSWTRGQGPDRVPNGKMCKGIGLLCGDRESYGKDAEAAMALSLGKPVIFYCDHERRSRFYREVHPFSRLVEFDTGVAVGAMVTDSITQVSELLFRLFENQMEYQLEQTRPGHLRLKEAHTGSVVRLQTSDEMLNAAFFNLYHFRDSALRLRRTPS